MSEDNLIRGDAREILNPLRQEMHEAGQRITFRQVEILRGCGLPVPDLLAAGLVGVTKGVVERTDYWSPSESGQSLIITPMIENAAIIDLIAFDLAKPNVWYLRTAAGWALGADAIEDAICSSEQRITLHACPIDWLRAGGTGACVTQWTGESRAGIRAVQRVDVTSNKFARALRLELTRPPRIPEIEVKGMHSRAA